MPPKYPTTDMCNGALLERFEPTVRDTDVFTATIAKCGQTWLCSLLHHLRERGADPGHDPVQLVDAVPWVEVPWDPRTQEAFDTDARLAVLESLPDPRIFKMHVVWEEIPRPPGSGARILTITRDPRDVPYSMYQHLIRLKRGPFKGKTPPPFEAFFESWFDNDFYCRFVDGFWPHRTDPDVLWLRYEDLKADTTAEAHRILAFLGWERTEAEVAAAVELASFGAMKARDDAGQLGFAQAFDQSFFREGAVGKNRARLTAQMEARIVDRVRSRFSAECADFLLAQG